MYSRLPVQSSRGVKQLELHDLQRLNLLLDGDNSGKTTAMEALFPLGGAATPSWPATISHVRGQRVFPIPAGPDLAAAVLPDGPQSSGVDRRSLGR
jgi:hypothetical protein